MSARRALVVVLVLVAALARVGVAGLERKPGADELVYRQRASTLAREGLRAGLRQEHAGYLVERAQWIFPPPIRWAQHAAGAAALRALGDEGLVRLSVASSIALVVLAALLARRVAGGDAAALTVALVAASPLGLHLGRRALADAPYAAVALGATWAFFEATRPTAGRATLVLALALCALQQALKEGGALLLVALGAVHVTLVVSEGRSLARGLALLAGAGALAVLGYDLLVGSPGAYLRALSCIAEAGPTNAYLLALQTGPPWTNLSLALLLAPVPLLLLPVALLRPLTRDPERTTAPARASLLRALGAMIIIHALVVTLSGASGMGYNARYLLPLDVPARVLAGAWLAASLPRAWAWGIVGLSVGLELTVFARVFVARGLYDPTLPGILEALR